MIASARAENLTLRLRFDDDGISRLKPDFALVVLKYWVLHAPRVESVEK